MLEEQIEDARRQTISDKQDFQHHKSIVRWQEEQLRIKQEEIVRMQKRHGSALRVSENKHRTLIDELRAKLASADDEIRQLTRRIKDMAKLLERSQIEEQECHQRCEYLDTQLSDARVFAAEASRLSADLTGQLSERAAYIGDLEQKIVSLMSCFPSPPLTSTCLGTGDSRNVVLRQGSVADCSRSGIISLHAEIAQATQLIGQSNMHSGFEFTKPSVAEPLLDDDHSCINNGNINNDCNTSGTTSCVLSSTAASDNTASLKNEPGGNLYWLAVYAHMVWSFYLRLMVLRYHSPLAQMLIMSSVCFLCPGMFNALNGLGGAGQLDTYTTNIANTALYATFCVFSIAGGGIVNVFGVRYTTSLSCLTYALYTGSYIYYNNTDNGTLTIVAGGILGIGAGILWTAQGVVMVSYPADAEKGKYISIFWVIFNLGGLVGGILPFAINFYHSGSLTDSVYALFVIFECAGAVAAMFLIPPARVVRDDGSHAIIVVATSSHREWLEVLKLFKNKWMLLLLPMSFTSNFFYGYQFSQYNAAIFTLRTRGFNNLMYWTSQIIGSYALSLLLDFSQWSRRRRGLCAVACMAVSFNIVWVGTFIIQRQYTKGGENTDYPGGPIDFLETSRASAPVTLYFFTGMVDAWYQNIAYWIIGALTGDAHITARYVGFYKGIQSLGAAISWQISAQEIHYMHQLIGNWALLVISLPTMVYTVMQIEDRALDDRLLSSPYTQHNDSSIFNDHFEWSALSAAAAMSPEALEKQKIHKDIIL
ncbi:hypothetical protein FB645_000287 [Coemansia sp. IMI 203386]|nr:hypothetical protein FB645_000287 [Coemansia sp. IMI 203386]